MILCSSRHSFVHSVWTSWDKQGVQAASLVWSMPLLTITLLHIGYFLPGERRSANSSGSSYVMVHATWAHSSACLWQLPALNTAQIALCPIGIFWFSCFFPGDFKWTWWSRRWREHVSVGTGLVWSTKFNFSSTPFCKDLQILPNYSRGCKQVKRLIKPPFSFRKQKLPRRQLYLTSMGKKYIRNNQHRKGAPPFMPGSLLSCSFFKIFSLDLWDKTWQWKEFSCVPHRQETGMCLKTDLVYRNPPYITTGM